VDIESSRLDDTRHLPATVAFPTRQQHASRIQSYPPAHHAACLLAGWGYVDKVPLYTFGGAWVGAIASRAIFQAFLGHFPILVGYTGLVWDAGEYTVVPLRMRFVLLPNVIDLRDCRDFDAFIKGAKLNTDYFRDIKKDFEHSDWTTSLGGKILSPVKYCGVVSRN
jgi:hypothetical protein